jgi:sugar lactone lactonase YvrE
VTTSIRFAIVLAALAAASSARAELGVVARGPIYADPKGVAFKAPEGVGCSATALVVADTGNGRLVSYEWKDGVTSGGSEIKVAQLPYPTRVQVDSKGNMLVLDRKARRIARLDPKGALQGWVEVKGAAVVPMAFKLDASDGLYILDMASSSVLVLDAAGAVTARIPLPKQRAIFTDVAVDGAGTVYALDALEAAVWSAPKGATEFKALSKGMRDLMSFPSYLTTDGKGALIVVDQNGSGLVLLGIDGSYLGRRLAMGWSDGSVYYPAQICVDESGDLAVADRGNNRVQLFSYTR